MVDKLSDGEIEDLAKLHMECHPEAAITAFGLEFVKAFYRYVGYSETERLFAQYEDGKIAGACVLSLEPHTIANRLKRKVPLKAWAAGILSGFSTLDVFRTVFCKLGCVFYARPAPMTTPEVIYIFADSSRRGRGIGSSLLSACEAFLIEIGASSYVVKTWDNEAHPTVKFYVKNGFRPGERIETFGKKLRYMEKMISND